MPTAGASGRHLGLAPMMCLETRKNEFIFLQRLHLYVCGVSYWNNFFDRAGTLSSPIRPPPTYS